MCPYLRSKERLWTFFSTGRVRRGSAPDRRRVRAGHGPITPTAAGTGRWQKPSAAVWSSLAAGGRREHAPVSLVPRPARPHQARATRRHRTTPTATSPIGASRPRAPTPNAIRGHMGAPSARRRATPSAISAKMRGERRHWHAVRAPMSWASATAAGRQPAVSRFRQAQLEQREGALCHTLACLWRRRRKAPDRPCRQAEPWVAAEARLQGTLEKQPVQVRDVPADGCGEQIAPRARGRCRRGLAVSGRSDMTISSIYGPYGPYMVIDCLGNASLNHNWPIQHRNEGTRPCASLTAVTTGIGSAWRSPIG